jgi:hypothetical protein
MGSKERWNDLKSVAQGRIKIEENNG